MHVEFCKYPTRNVFEISLDDTAHVMSVEKAVELAKWINELAAQHSVRPTGCMCREKNGAPWGKVVHDENCPNAASG